MPLLQVTDLHVHYGGAVAVRGIDLHVEAGEVALVLGANGAGKTSSLRAIAGQLRPSKGSIRWNGTDISHWPSFRVCRAGLVLVPEGRKVFAPLTVEENLSVGGFTSKSRKQRLELIDQVYAMFPILKTRKDQAAGLLSGGEQQMLAFGRAMMAQPKAILMDEPSMGLSPAMVDTVMDAIGEIARTGLGILLVEQNAMAALAVASRAVVLERGSIVLTGSADEVRNDPDVVKAFLGSRSGPSRSVPARSVPAQPVPAQAGPEVRPGRSRIRNPSARE
jgi:branched-chain amino acid transport system ATP-binding protein